MASRRRFLCLTWSRYYGKCCVRGALGGAMGEVLWEEGLYEEGGRGSPEIAFTTAYQNSFLQLFARNSFLQLFARNCILQFFSISGSLALIKPCLGRIWHRKHICPTSALLTWVKLFAQKTRSKSALLLLWTSFWALRARRLSVFPVWGRWIWAKTSCPSFL